MIKYFTGIGSRGTPSEIQDVMRKIGCKLAKSGYILRSGGADGADKSFELGFDECNIGQEKEIYLPWPNFNSHNSQLYRPINEAFEIALQFHPKPEALSKGVRKLHARNVHQVLGKDLRTPSDFVICWTESKGGTQQALRIAEHYSIPIYNLIDKKHRKQLGNLLKKI